MYKYLPIYVISHYILTPRTDLSFCSIKSKKAEIRLDVSSGFILML